MLKLRPSVHTAEITMGYKLNSELSLAKLDALLLICDYY